MQLINKYGENSTKNSNAIWLIALSWGLVIIWALVIFFMSAHTGSDLNEGDDFIALVKQWLNDIQMHYLGPGVDLASSIAHFCEFTVFGALLANAFGKHFSRRWLLIFLLAVLVASIYAITDEVHQIFVPDRACDPIDWIVDTAGAMLGAAIWLAAARRIVRRKQVEN
ncbi:VanZ family protein [Adlercreutzia sp. ZJ304]|uniref:VanZ family protein n=1 Tax=Adlercreutzia sp. ZJ304 TaxID=2709791 RepID=UPI0013EC61B0|nr:VanZ family protein [Adlercreutzia sp. ZJ304]